MKIFKVVKEEEKMYQPIKKVGMLMVLVSIAFLLLESSALGEKVTLKWLEWEDVTQRKATGEIIRAFEWMHPNVKVEFVGYSGDLESQQKLLAQMVAGTAPDVLTGWDYIPWTWASKNQLLDLRPYVEKYLTKEQISQFYPVIWNWFVYEGKRIAVPKYTSPMVLYYNVDAFDEVGLSYPTKDWTWDDLLKAAQKLTKKENGRIVRFGFQESVELYRLCMWIWQNGGRIHPEGNRSVCTLDEPKAIEAMQFIHDLTWKYNVSPKPGQALRTATDEAMEANFIAGKVAMTEQGSWCMAYFPEQCKFEFNVAHLPKGPVKRATMITTDCFAVYKNTKHPDLAVELAIFAAGPVGAWWNQKYAAMQAALKPIAEVFPEMFPEKYNTKVFQEAMAYGIPSPVMNKQKEFIDMFNAARDQAFVLNKISVEEAMKEFVSKVNKMLQSS